MFNTDTTYYGLLWYKSYQLKEPINYAYEEQYNDGTLAHFEQFELEQYIIFHI